jgi:pimeloyl-ACP methyl ester carboxylesterase
MQAMRLEHVVLVGHSFGGGPTVEAALLDPSRIQALVLVDVALGLRDAQPAPSPNPILKGVLAVTPLRDALVATLLTNPGFTKRLLESFVDNPAAASEARVRIYQQPLAVEGTTAAVGQWLPELMIPTPGAASAEPASYRALTMPTLVLWGRKDTITPLVQGQRVASLLPRATLSVIDNVGHIPQIEGTAEFNRRLLEVFSELHLIPR